MKQLTESPNNNEDSDDEGGGWAGGRELPHFEEITAIRNELNNFEQISTSVDLRS